MYHKQRLLLKAFKHSAHLFHTNQAPCSNKQYFLRQNQLKPDNRPPWPSWKDPTPYDILGMQKGQPYHKMRFYNLVKTYHPDLKMTSSSRLSKDTQIQRFRLVVAAHEILSDDRKRAVHDTHGIGWLSGSPDATLNNDIKGNPFTNRNHDRWGARPQKDFDMWEFLSTHKYIVRLLVVIFTFGEICLFLVTLFKADIELKRLDKECRELVSRRQSRSLGVSNMLQLERFLLRRDPSGMGLFPSEMESYGKMLSLCLH